MVRCVLRLPLVIHCPTKCDCPHAPHCPRTRFPIAFTVRMVDKFQHVPHLRRILRNKYLNTCASFSAETRSDCLQNYPLAESGGIVVRSARGARARSAPGWAAGRSRRASLPEAGRGRQAGPSGMQAGSAAQRSRAVRACAAPGGRPPRPRAGAGESPRTVTLRSCRLGAAAG
jgi:hypothetical protein